MNSLIVRQMPDKGQDAKIFRAYGVGNRSLGVNVSATGSADYAALRCAAKAFAKYSVEPAEIEEIETRIVIVPKTSATGEKRWEANLQPNAGAEAPATDDVKKLKTLR